MSSEVDVVNLALAHLGDVANVVAISPPDGSMQAEYASRFYPQARDTLLEMHDWSFATTFAPLAQLAANTSPTWGYAYERPADLIKVIGLAPAGSRNALLIETMREEIDAFGRPAWLAYLDRGFVLQADAIYSNTANAIFAFTKRVTDTARFSPLAVRTLGWILASDLAGPILKGQTGAKATVDCMNMARSTLSMASVSDANQQATRKAHVPSWIAGR